MEEISVMLSQEKRDMLARGLMGWELSPRAPATEHAKQWAYWNTEFGTIRYTSWLSSPTLWAHSGLVFDKLAEYGCKPRLYIDYALDGNGLRCCSFEDRGYMYYGRETDWPSAIARAAVSLVEQWKKSQ